jgi:hypothetical protein
MITYILLAAGGPLTLQLLYVSLNSPYIIRNTPTINNTHLDALNFDSVYPIGISFFSLAVRGLSNSCAVNPIRNETSPVIIKSTFICR